MDSKLEDLNKIIIDIYKKNILFLKDNFPELFDRIDELSTQIEEGKFKEKYTLEYVNGYFDILNNENNGYFYHTNSYEDADQRAENVSFNTTNSLDLLRKNPQTKKLLNSELYKDVAPIIDHLNEVVDFENVEFQKIFKFVYIGTGLGFHIQQIDKKINSLTTLILEKELEIFRLSLFVTDYTVFEEGSRKLFFGIGENYIDRIDALNNFSEYHKYMNYNVKYNTLLVDGKEIKEELVQYFSINNVGSFPYKLVIQNLNRLVGFIKNKDRFLNLPSILEHNILANKKVLMIAAGPSLGEYIEWIAEHQDKFIIVTVDVIVKKLEQHDIVPQIIVSIDPSELCAEFMKTEDPEYLKDSGFLFLSQQHADVMKLVEDKHYYISQVMPLINDIGYLGSTPNVGTYSFELAAYLGAQELYIIGNDAAFDQKTGDRYSDGTSVQSRFESNITEESKDPTMINAQDVFEVKGNLQEKVKTNRILYPFKENYEEALRHFESKELKVFNLSNGVYMEGMIPCTREEIDEKVKSFEKESLNIIEALDKVSIVIEDLDVENDIKTLNNIILRIKKFQKLKVTSKDDFLQNKLDIMIWILEKTKEMDSIIYGNIFLEFTSLIDIYVNYLLNLRQKNIHSKAEINKISQLWAKGALTMFKDIKDALH